MPTPKLRESDRITKNSAIETEPALSPDGRYLALISDRTGSPQVYVRDMQRKKLSVSQKTENITFLLPGLLMGNSLLMQVRVVFPRFTGLIRNQGRKQGNSQEYEWESQPGLLMAQ